MAGLEIEFVCISEGLTIYDGVLSYQVQLKYSIFPHGICTTPQSVLHSGIYATPRRSPEVLAPACWFVSPELPLYLH